ncbi:transporter substrate-binding domain-containing protein [Rubrobacter marinus]|uniref:Transporter substrate-binding domain-containing protein n=1 Tax=Rubrobacter marinus TaxID=2653852 RepID=A0A6G8Q357_9ACTN|nr:transporter substrate-binding domain-containing protein [Rubrobacter marinus]
MFAASGCILSGGGGGQSGGTATVRVGTTNSSSDAPFFIGDKKGYFEEQGIKVEFNSFDSAAKMIAPLGNGDLDVAAGAPSAGLYNAVARGVDFKMVADKGSTPAGYGYMPLLVTSGSASSFDGYEDLEGMKVAEPAQGTATSSTLNEALKKAGLSYDDVEHEYIGFPDHVAALENGSIDASLTTEPSATRAIQTGAATRFAGTDEIYPDQQLAVVLYSGQFAQDDAEVARKFMVGYLRAVRDYNDALNNGKLAGPNAEEVISILTEFTPVKDAGLYQEMTPNGVDPNGELNLDSLEKDLQFFKDEGLLESDAVTIDGVVDTSFVEAASEELGPYEKPEEG